MGFDTILVANRGEIACRIIRTARAMGLRSVAVYSSADADAPHVAMADDAIHIGPAPAAESYLNTDAILAAARGSGAQALHPGYGFLSENAGFARAVADAGLTFIGPPPQAIEIMGDKAAAKRAMQKAGVPCVPGYHGTDQSDRALLAEAAKIGMPLMVKAAAGGGGHGMRLVTDPGDLPDALSRARSEAQSAFGNDSLILERAIRNPRHVEIQVFADRHGTILHLGERDCSIQRRHQKVVEEAPCPVLTRDQRDAMGAAAIAAARAVGYEGAGTVEFLLDDSGAFYFLEMNTRLQVEHPVTEMVTGLDLVEWQIAVASGQPLPLRQTDLALQGHAIEVRLYAEDPARDFLPVTGRVHAFRSASGPGIRVDAGIATGQMISPYYDPMLAKIVAHGPTRETARQRLLAALRQTLVLGLTTNAGHLADILRHPHFVQGRATTAFIADHMGQSRPPAPAREDMAAIAALILQDQADQARDRAGLPDDSLMGFASDGGHAVPLALWLGDTGSDYALHATGPGGWSVEDGKGNLAVQIVGRDGPLARVTVEGRARQIGFVPDGAGGAFAQAGAGGFHVLRRQGWSQASAPGADGQVLAPLPGLVVAVAVETGQSIAQGQIIAVIEAMKMQHQIRATVSGTVAALHARPDQQIENGALIATIDKDDA